MRKVVRCVHRNAYGSFSVSYIAFIRLTYQCYIPQDIEDTGIKEIHRKLNLQIRYIRRVLSCFNIHISKDYNDEWTM